MAKKETIPVQVSSPTDYIIKNLSVLALVNPLLEKMQIRDFVNAHCEQDSRLELSVGHVIHALVANRLCSPQPLLHVAEWADATGAEFVLGTPAASLNDDRLGRALDAIFSRRWNILADVALHVADQFGIGLTKLHYDPTSFHFTGESDNHSPDPSLVPHLRPFKIELGRHAQPGRQYKEAQLGVDLANDGKGPVPIFYHSLDGSSNDTASCGQNLQHLLTYLKPNRLLLIHDRGCFSAENAVTIVREHHFHFISSLRWSDPLATLYDEKRPPMLEASFLSMKEKCKRRLNKPKETWEHYHIGEIPHTFSHDGKSIKARLIFVHSSADEKACVKAREKYTKKIRDELSAVKRSVEGGYTKEVRAVHKRINRIYGKKAAQKYFTYDVAKLTEDEIRALPPRKPGQRRRSLKFSFQYHPDIADKDVDYDGIYAIATSLPKRSHSTDQVFTAFKEQHHIETAHHQWKAPIRLRPVFLKKPSRIESLVLIQFLALQAFYVLQRLYRISQGSSCRTTSESLFRAFLLAPIQIHPYDRLLLVSPVRPTPPQQDILNALNFPHIGDQILPAASHPFS